MVGEAFDVFSASVSVECFQGLEDTGMEGAPSFLRETPIGHLVGARSISMYAS
jgi:hypothetical protein